MRRRWLFGVLAGMGFAAGMGAVLAGTTPDPKADAALRADLAKLGSYDSDATLAALDKAEAAGANLADVEALRIPLLAKMVDDGSAKTDQAEFDHVTDLALRMLKDVLRFEDDSMESHLDPSLLPTKSGTTKWPRDGYGWVLSQEAVFPASRLLALLDFKNSKRADEVRHALRLVTKYDPLHGNPGRDYTSTLPWLTGRAGTIKQYYDNWAASPEEEAAQYKLLFADNSPSLPTDDFASADLTYCSRFFPSPRARVKAFKAMVESLKDNPRSEQMYLILRTHFADAVLSETSEDRVAASDAYAQLIDELWKNRDELAGADTVSSGLRFYPLVSRWNPLQENVRLIHYLLKCDEPGRYNPQLLRYLLATRIIPAEEVPATWEEMKRYQAATQAVSRKYKPIGYYEENVDALVSEFVSAHPDVCRADPAVEPDEKDALTVSRFWTPSPYRDNPLGMQKRQYLADIFQIEVCPDGVWVDSEIEVTPAESGTEWHESLCHVSLPDMKTEKLSIAGNQNVMDFCATDDALFVQGHIKAPEVMDALSRYDVHKKAWETRPMRAYDSSQMYLAGGTMYFISANKRTQGTAIDRYDWNEDKWTDVASTLHEPLLSQFTQSLFLFSRAGIYDGPGGKPIINIPDHGVYLVSEGREPWSELYNGSGHQIAYSTGDRTLFRTQSGEAVMVDAHASSPAYWMANALPHVRHPTEQGYVGEKVATPWADKAKWVLSEDQRPTWEHGVGFNDETLYLLEEAKQGGPFTLVCMTKGSLTPQRIPLLFRMDPLVLERLPKTSSSRAKVGVESNEIFEHPQRINDGNHPKLRTTHQGLCLTFPWGGFWFIPFSDIDDFVKKHPAAKL